MKSHQCSTVCHKNGVWELISPSFVYELDIRNELMGQGLVNRLAGETVVLGNGPEVLLETDASEQRLWITSWRGLDPQKGKMDDPDDDVGIKEKWYAPEFDDSGWSQNMSPALFWMTGDPQYYWCRTHVFVPRSCAGKPMTLVLGGIGMFDFQYMRVFLNGHEIGIRSYQGVWHAPLEIALGDGSTAGQHLRIGQDNVITLQLADPVRRTEKLNQLDPQQTRTLPWLQLIPPQFEQYISVGECNTEQVSLTVKRVKVLKEGKTGAVDVELVSTGKARLEVTVHYRWTAECPALRKQVSVHNRSRSAIRLMHLQLGNYCTGNVCSDGDQGFPVYIDGHTYMSLAHPAGWNIGDKGRIELRQYPGVMLKARQRWKSMEAVIGVAARSQARQAFLTEVRGRMRRVKRGHDKTYAIWESFASWDIPQGNFLGDACSEAHLLKNIDVMHEAMRTPGNDFDIFHVEFWVDNAGDIRRAAPKRFPEQFTNIVKRLNNKPALGLWIDSSQGVWSIGDNPVVAASATNDPSYQKSINEPLAYMCRAADPARSLYEDGFRYHIRDNGVRMCKFDNLQAICYNTHHDHLPGIYSTEAIMNAVIEFLHALDEESRDVFLMLYWGYRSPWWLLHADTLFEPGLCVEAAHPSSVPTPYARDGVTLGLDQAHWFAEDIPALGKDSLGVWLSDWGWNSMIGKERWQEGFIMDMCRGNLLAQPWGDNGKLTLDERHQMGTFIRLLRERPECFSQPRFVVGNPWKNEPYGYCCTDGNRAFIAVNNVQWSDAELILQLDESWGLTGQGWDLYRWYPQPARLVSKQSPLMGSVPIRVRPFEVVLLEVVPQGQLPSLNGQFREIALESIQYLSRPARKSGPDANALQVTFKPAPEDKGLILRWEKDFPDDNQNATKKSYQIEAELPGAGETGMLVLSVDRLRQGKAYLTNFPGREMAVEVRIDGRLVKAEPVLDIFVYPTSWQAWRIPVDASEKSRKLEAVLTVLEPVGMTIHPELHGLPSIQPPSSF